MTAVTGISSAGEPITPDMRFGIGSNTKTFVAVLLLKLQELGVLSLDDPLDRWLPAFNNVDSLITIRQLLAHQSGIFDMNRISNYWNVFFDDTSRFWTPREIMPTIESPDFVRGTSYRYSNTNYLLAGMIIDSATGKSWIQNLHDLILDPLEMNSTFVGANEKINGPVAHEWITNYGEVPFSPMTSAFSHSYSVGSILSTAREMTEWYQALFNGEIISQESLIEFTNFEASSFYGLGIIYSLYKDHMSYCHGGATLGYTSQIYFDNQTKAIICLLINDKYTDTDTRFIPLLNVFFDEYPKKQNDAGISGLTRPVNSICNGSVAPSVTLKNFGSSSLTSVDINYQVDTAAPSVYQWTGQLNSGEFVQVELPSMTVDNGPHTFTSYTSAPNGGQEGNTYNDTAQTNFLVNTVPAMISELFESFDGNIFPPDGWTVSSSALKGDWVSTSLARYSGTGSAVYPNWTDKGIGNYYDLELPVMNIPGSGSTNLSFRYSYGLFSGFNGDSLQILISRDCGLTWQKIYNKGGSRLGTSGSSIAFYPLLKGYWKKETISLSDFPGNLLIRFRNICGYGNNLFLDDVEVKQLTGIRETSLADNFTVYPNPASSNLNISGLPVDTEIQVTDLTGKLLMTEKSANSITSIEIKELRTGIYILKTALGVKKILKM